MSVIKLQRVLETIRVEPGKKARLSERDTDWRDEPELRGLTSDQLKGRAKDVIERSLNELTDAQERLWADDRRSVLVVLQAMDAAGKDSAIKHIMSGVNPQGCTVRSFKQPSAEELDHTFLWRSMKAAPERGKIVIFNRSHYEDVLVVKVHPKILDTQKLPPGKRGKSFWNARYDDINAFERHLHRNGVLILKFFLHVSKKEQKQRLLARLENPDKLWKFSMADLRERDYWNDYMDAYDDMLTETSTAWAPWHVVPADHKWVTRAVIASVMAHEIDKLDLQFPEPDPELVNSLDEARRRLEAD